ncbi:protein BatD [bacterium]|nr:protein BatD [bacterium]
MIYKSRNLVLTALVALLLVLLGNVFAEDINITASVNRNKIGIDDELALSVKVESSNLKGVNKPELPELEDFAILSSSTSQSHSFSFGMGGKSVSSSVKTYEYTLAPQKEGTLVIGAIELKHGGKTYTTSPINVEVVKGSVTGGGGRTASPRQSSGDVNLDPQDVKENIFLSTYPDKRKAYVGEQITLDQTLFTRLAVLELHPSKSPSFEGFWTEDIFSAKRLDYTRKVINGKAYNAALLQKVALFPLAPGKKTIEPMELKAGIQVDSRDFFGFFGRKEIIDLTGKPVTIDVMPLPTQGKPASFNGAVGNFTIRAYKDKDQIAANEALTIKIEIAGTGNTYAIGEPEINLPADFEKYETQVNESQSKDNNKISGKKTFEYVVVPRVAGSYVIPPIEFSYFDPVKEAYRSLKTDSLKIEVSPGEGGTEPGVKVVSKGEVINVGKDIGYIKPDMQQMNTFDFSNENQWKRFFWLPIELLAILIAVIYKQRKVRIIEDEVYARNIKALREAKQKLKKAGKRYKDNPGEALSAVTSSVTGYIADRLNLPPAGLIFRDIVPQLVEKGVAEDLILRTDKLIDTCNLARYAPGQIEFEFNDLIKEASGILKQLDRKLR